MAAVRPLGPGPGAYLLPSTVGYPDHDPSRYRNPMYSFGMNVKFKQRTLGPGPAYALDRITREGLITSPAWSFGARLGRAGIVRTPGPGAHAPERCPPFGSPRPPAYSMGARLDRTGKLRTGPAPNAYMVRTELGGPAYSMGMRLGRLESKGRSPGPAVYYQRDLDVVLPSTPKFSLGARIIHDKYQRTPGPAAYPPNLYNTKKCPYSYTFGMKHSPWTPPLIIKEDTMDCL